MDEDNKSNWIGGIIGILIVGAIIWWFSGAGKYEGRTAEEWFNVYDYETARNEELENRLSDYQTALEEANSNIENAKGYAWESYEDMGDALDSLDTVPEP